MCSNEHILSKYKSLENIYLWRTLRSSRIIVILKLVRWIMIQNVLHNNVISIALTTQIPLGICTTFQTTLFTRGVWKCLKYSLVMWHMRVTWCFGKGSFQPKHQIISKPVIHWRTFQIRENYICLGLLPWTVFKKHVAMTQDIAWDARTTYTSLLWKIQMNRALLQTTCLHHPDRKCPHISVWHKNDHLLPCVPWVLCHSDVSSSTWLDSSLYWHTVVPQHANKCKRAWCVFVFDFKWGYG